MKSAARDDASTIFWIGLAVVTFTWSNLECVISSLRKLPSWWPSWFSNCLLGEICVIVWFPVQYLCTRADNLKMKAVFVLYASSIAYYHIELVRKQSNSHNGTVDCSKDKKKKLRLQCDNSELLLKNWYIDLHLNSQPLLKSSII